MVDVDSVKASIASDLGLGTIHHARLVLHRLQGAALDPMRSLRDQGVVEGERCWLELLPPVETAQPPSGVVQHDEQDSKLDDNLPWQTQLVISRDADGLGLSRRRGPQAEVEPLTDEILQEWGVTLQVPADWPMCLEAPNVAEVAIEIISRKTGAVIDHKMFQRR